MSTIARTGQLANVYPFLPQAADAPFLKTNTEFTFPVVTASLFFYSCPQLEACRLLLGAGAAVAARDHARRTPLHYAGSSAEVTRLLLDFGADPEAKVYLFFSLHGGGYAFRQVFF